MNIRDYEETISSIIVDRGRGIYYYDEIESISKLSNHHYKGKVQGTHLYDVEIEVDDEYEILNITCTCPYALKEPYCKHQVAILLAIRELLGFIDSDDYDQRAIFREIDGEYIKTAYYHPAHSSETYTSIDEINSLIALQTKDDFAESFEYILHIPWMRNLLAITLFKEEENREIDWLKDIEKLRSLFQGFLAFIEIPFRPEQKGIESCYTKAVEKLFVLRDAAFIRSEWNYVLRLNLLLLTQYMLLAEHKMEIPKSFSSNVIESLHSLVQKTYKDEEVGENITTYLMNEIKDFYLKGLSYSHIIDFMYVMLPLASHHSIKKALYKFSRNIMIASSHHSKGGDLFNSSIATYLYSMMKEYGSVKEFEHVINSYKTFKEMRNVTIQHANQEVLVEIGDAPYCSILSYQKLIVARKWAKAFVFAIEAKGDANARIAIAKGFLLENREMKYYYELKKLCERNRWDKILSSVLLYIEEQMKEEDEQQPKSTFTPLKEFYANILIAEHLSESLIELITPFPHVVRVYSKHLLPDAQTQVYSLYQQLIYSAASNTETNGLTVELLNELIQIHGKEEALLIIDELKQMYKERESLITLLETI